MTTTTATDDIREAWREARATFDAIPRGWAVRVRYAGPTNYRGSRWIATADHPIGRATVSYDHSLDTGAQNAIRAAGELCARWTADYAKRYPDAPPREHRVIAWGHDKDAYTFIVTGFGG